MPNQPTTEELSSALAAVAQGCINIAEGMTAVEEGSRIYEGMAAVCRHGQLLKAAPRMLLALQSVRWALEDGTLKDTDHDPDGNSIHAIVDAAIHAAEGGE